jgi:hypothetical protein
MVMIYYGAVKIDINNTINYLKDSVWDYKVEEWVV